MKRMSKKRKAQFTKPQAERLVRTLNMAASGDVKALAEVFEAVRAVYDPVYDAVDARAGRLCEVVLDGGRCPRLWQEHHHTVKPRASHHTPRYVMAICRWHHDAVDRPFKRGRLLTVPNGDGSFRCAIVTAPDKFTYRHRLAGPAPNGGIGGSIV
jgi:hypothetical protein